MRNLDSTTSCHPPHTHTHPSHAAPSFLPGCCNASFLASFRPILHSPPATRGSVKLRDSCFCHTFPWFLTMFGIKPKYLSCSLSPIRHSFSPSVPSHHRYRVFACHRAFALARYTLLPHLPMVGPSSLCPTGSLCHRSSSQLI